MSNVKRKRKMAMPKGMYLKSRKSRLKKMLEDNLTSLINMRTIGSSKICSHNSHSTLPNFGTKCMIKNKHFNENLYPCDTMDKIFTSMWINDKQVIYGTKCNKLMVMDVTTNHSVQIPSLRSSNTFNSSEAHCGNHSICVNPSRTMLATGAENSNDIAVYRLPTFDPVCIGEMAHSDWVFDISWLDDEFFVSGSRDTTLALWRIDNSSNYEQDNYPKYTSIEPLLVKRCKKAEKVRALVFNKNYQELVALSVNAYLHLWDANTFKQKYSQPLPFCLENVCLAMQEEQKLYAVGSKSHVSLLDTCALKLVCEIPSEHAGCSIRSTSFNKDILTIGTGMGTVMFYDIRARKYMEQYYSPSNTEEMPVKQSVAKLTTSQGYVKKSSMFWELYHSDKDYHPAIYTHCYDYTGTRLFVAGGPLPAFLEGCYLGLWQ